jgi:hypothetical protein
VLLCDVSSMRHSRSKPAESTHGISVHAWLHESNLDNLIPIFEREQLTDWSYVKLLTIPLLQSIHVPLGLAFEFQIAIQNTFGPEVCANPDFESTALALYEWIATHGQSHSKRNMDQNRPPWRGTLEKQTPKKSVPVKSEMDSNRKKFTFINSEYLKLLKLLDFQSLLAWFQINKSQIISCMVLLSQREY